LQPDAVRRTDAARCEIDLDAFLVRSGDEATLQTGLDPSVVRIADAARCEIDA
jgi:hypothetical protein